MMKIHISVIAVLGCLLLGACAAGGTMGAAAFSSAHPAPMDHLIVPGQRIGSVYLGMTEQDLLRTMGRPDKIVPAGNDSFYCFGVSGAHSCNGFWVYVWHGQVTTVSVSGSMGAEYHTAKGPQAPALKVGSYASDVGLAMGTALDCHEGYSSSEYDKIYDGVLFEIKRANNDVSAISVRQQQGC